MDQIYNMKKVVQLFVKIINTALVLFLVAVSIPGYLHIYNNYIKSNPINISRIAIGIAAIALPAYILIIIFIKMKDNKKLGIKSLIFNFFATILALILGIGYIGFSDIHDIAPIGVMFMLIYAFAAGMSFTLNSLKYSEYITINSIQDEHK